MEKIGLNYQDLAVQCIGVLEEFHELYLIAATDYFLGSNSLILTKNHYLKEITEVIEKTGSAKINNAFSTGESAIADSQTYLQYLKMNEILQAIQNFTFKMQGKVSKKTYEVEVFSEFISKEFVGALDAPFFVEMGCGKSYLHKELQNLCPQISYFGIDKQDELVAKGKSDKTLRVFNYLVNHSNYRNTFEKIADEDSEFKACVDKGKEGVLLGLHSCGNLTSDTIKIFADSECKMFKKLMIVGCCFNLIKEFIKPKAKESERFKHYINSLGFSGKGEMLDSTILGTYDFDEVGYPLSSFLLNDMNDSIFLGRVLRNAAMQAHNFFQSPDFEESIYKLFCRALLQRFLEIYIPELSKFYGFGKIKVKPKSFFSYLESILLNFKSDKSGLKKHSEQLESLMHNSELMASFIEKYETKAALRSFTAFYFLRIKFAKCIELLVNLDRVLYLEEAGFIEVKLIKIFDSEFSERNFLISAQRK